MSRRRRTPRQALNPSSVLKPSFPPKHHINADSTEVPSHSSSDSSRNPAIIEKEEDHTTRHSPATAAAVAVAANSRSYRRRLCKCVTGLTMDCAALCCCPFTLLHLLSLVLVRLPSRIVSRLISKLVTGGRQEERRRRLSDVEERDGPSPTFSPSWSFREPPSYRYTGRRGFGDENLWADYFDAGRQPALQNMGPPAKLGPHQD